MTQGPRCITEESEIIEAQDISGATPVYFETTEPTEKLHRLGRRGSFHKAEMLMRKRSSLKFLLVQNNSVQQQLPAFARTRHRQIQR